MLLCVSTRRFPVCSTLVRAASLGRTPKVLYSSEIQSGHDLATEETQSSSSHIRNNKNKEVDAEFPANTETASNEADSKKKGKGTRKSSKRKSEVILPPRRIPRAADFLEQLSSSGAQPTVEDLKRFTPRTKDIRRLLNAGDLKGYRALYESTAEAISKSFNVSQLYTLALELNVLPQRSSSKKSVPLKAILGRHFDMPSPDEEERKKREATDLKEQNFPVTPAQLFLLLGEDGHKFKALASQFRVQLFVEQNPSSLAPLRIRAIGSTVQLAHLRSHLAEHKKSQSSETLSISPRRLNIRSELLEPLSRISGALVQNTNAGEVDITSDEPSRAETAKRLVSLAALNDAISDNSNILAHVYAHHLSQSNSSSPERDTAVPSLTTNPAEPPARTETSPPTTLPTDSDKYTFYPFLPPYSFPWVMGSRPRDFTSFRPRRVEERLYGHKLGNIASLNDGVVLEKTGTPVSGLREHLLDLLDSPDNSNIIVTASTGHVLFTQPQRSQSSTFFSSPVPGTWSISKAFEWIREGLGRATFTPGLPAPLLNQTPENSTEVLRLTYRHLPSTSAPTSSVQPSRILICEVPLLSADDLPMRVIVGSSVRVDMVLPDRPMDLQFTVSSTREIDAADYPPTLTAFVEGLVESASSGEDGSLPEGSASDSNLETVPSSNDQSGTAAAGGSVLYAPLTLTFEDLTYYLESNATVRRAEDIEIPSEVSSSPSSTGSGQPWPLWPELIDLKKRDLEVTPILGVVESSVDLESSDESSTCMVACSDARLGGLEWEAFLRGCDRLTLHVYPAVPAGQRAPSLSTA